MGLEARVYVNARSLRGVDPTSVDTQTGEVISESDQQFIALQRRLGNATMIAWLSTKIGELLINIESSVLLTKVLYSGTHSGDVINIPDLHQLRREIEVVRRNAAANPDIEITEFLGNLEELIRTAREEDNPIVFV